MTGSDFMGSLVNLDRCCAQLLQLWSYQRLHGLRCHHLCTLGRGTRFLSSGHPWMIVVINLGRRSFGLASLRRRDSVESVRRLLRMLDSSVISVLNTSKLVTLACTGVASAAFKRASGR